MAKKFFVGLNTGLVDGDLNPDSRCVEFYSSRSGNGLHCAIVGNVVLPSGFGTNGKTARISNSLAWRNLAEVIAARGAIPGIQFSSTWADYKGERRFISREPEVAYKAYLQAAKEITQEQISVLMSQLASGSQLAIKHGFRHIQLHAAHGYVFNLAVHPMFNPHSKLAHDEILSWLDTMRTSGIQTSIRISLSTGWPKVDADYFSGLTSIIDLPFDYVDLSDGFYNLDKRKIYPSTIELSQQRFDLSAAVAVSNPSKNFILSGQAKKFVAELPDNLHLGFCRDLIANPDFLQNMENGCTLCNKCHYYSRGEDSLICPNWQLTDKVQ